jgi:hypothetical protein
MMALAGLRRRRADVAAAGLVALALFVALAALVASTPSEPDLVVSIVYTLGWGSPAGMFAWLALAWGIATLWLPRSRPSGQRASRLGPALGLVASAAVATAVAVSPEPDSREQAYEPSRTISARLEAAVSGERSVLVRAWTERAGGLLQFDIYTAVVYALRKHGLAVKTPDRTMTSLLGHSYRAVRSESHEVVLVGDRSPPPGKARVLAHISPLKVFGEPPRNPLTGRPGTPEPDFAVTLLRPAR